MSIIRISHNKENPYVMLNKNGLEDPNLSWGAKGLWAYLMSRPDDWEVSVPHLSTIYEKKGGGEKAIYSLLNELIDNGYCIRTKPKDDKGLFGKTEYTITEFKNKVPHSPQRDVVERDAVEVTLTNKGVIQRKETTTQQAVAVFDCLTGIGLSDDEMQSLTKEYRNDEAALIHAVKYATHKDTRIKTTLIQTIRWAAKQKPDIPKTQTDKTTTNKQLAQKLKEIALCPRGVTFEIFREYVEVSYNGGSSGSYTPFTLAYTETGFEEQLKNVLRKYDIRDKTNPINKEMKYKLNDLGL